MTQFNMLRMSLGFFSLFVLVPLSDAVDLTVRIEVVSSPPCIISGSDTIDINVDFGNIMISEIDGARYKTPINYYLTCTGQYQQKLKIRFLGSPAGFESNLLKTSENGLGIKLLSNDNQLSLNQWINFTYDPSIPNDVPRLYAVPVSSPTISLNPGEFTAVATLQLLYQ